MKVLVVGGAGYIGSVMTRVLVEQGHDVAVLDNLSLGHRAAVAAPARLHEVELGDGKAVDRVVGEERPECVMHFAARSLVGESVENPQLYFTNNVAYGVNLLNAAGHHGVGRFVFSSTAAVYGEPEKVPITEDALLAPTNPYGASKRIFEELLREYARTFGFSHACLRYFNVAGAYRNMGEDHRPETHLIPNILKAALERGRKFTIFGGDYDTRDGTNVRDYIHVHDLARAHLLAMEALKDGSLVYNLGSENGYSNREVFKTAEEVTGRKIPYQVGPRRPGDPATLVASSERIRNDLGWHAELGLEQMIRDAWEFLNRYPNGYPDQAAPPA